MQVFGAYQEQLMDDSSSKTYALLLSLALLSLFITIRLPVMGEEAVYVNSLFEMFNNRDYTMAYIYGGPYGRPPMINWLSLPLMHILGPTSAALSLRLLTVMITGMTTFVTIMLAHRFYKNLNIAILSGCFYLSGDLLFRRGWLAYSDPLFSFWILLSVGFAWLAIENKIASFIVLASLSCLAAGYTKTYISYYYLLASFVVIGVNNKNYKFFRSLKTILALVISIIIPGILASYIRHDGVEGTSRNLGEFFNLIHPLQYLYKLAVTFPSCLLLISFPFGIISIAFVKKYIKDGYIVNSDKILLSLAILFIIPVWLAADFRIRYLLPVYPILSILYARVIYKYTNTLNKYILNILVLTLIIKFTASNYINLYSANSKGDAEAVALDIMSTVGDKDVYIIDSTASGLRIVAEMNRLRYPKAPVTYPPNGDGGYYLIIKYTVRGDIIKTYSLGRDKVNLTYLPPQN